MKTIFAAVLMIILATTAHAALEGRDIDALQGKLIRAESSGNAKSVGDNGLARGLMQIHEATWKFYTTRPWDEAFDAETNVMVGRAVLEQIAEVYRDKLGDRATPAHVAYTYNTGRYCFGPLPNWTKKHPNKIYRRIFNGTAS